jgi:hypothetical protein
MTANVRYKHLQLGYVTLMGLAIGLVLGIVKLSHDGPSPLVLGALALLGLLSLLFSSQTIEIGDGKLRSHFGPSFLTNALPLGRVEVLLSEIESATPIAVAGFYGWGIRQTPQGWLYNVSGTRAVQINLKRGESFILGTDDPEQLCQTINGLLVRR